MFSDHVEDVMAMINTLLSLEVRLAEAALGKGAASTAECSLLPGGQLLHAPHVADAIPDRPPPDFAPCMASDAVRDELWGLGMHAQRMAMRSMPDAAHIQQMFGALAAARSPAQRLQQPYSLADIADRSFCAMVGRRGLRDDTHACGVQLFLRFLGTIMAAEPADEAERGTSHAGGSGMCSDAACAHACEHAGAEPDPRQPEAAVPCSTRSSRDSTLGPSESPSPTAATAVHFVMPEDVVQFVRLQQFCEEWLMAVAIDVACMFHDSSESTEELRCRNPGSASTDDPVRNLHRNVLLAALHYDIACIAPQTFLAFVRETTFGAPGIDANKALYADARSVTQFLACRQFAAAALPSTLAAAALFVALSHRVRPEQLPPLHATLAQQCFLDSVVVAVTTEFRAWCANVAPHRR